LTEVYRCHACSCHEIEDGTNPADVRVAYYSLQGQYEETVRSVTSAVPLFGCSLTLMVGYIMFSLGKWGDKARYSKIHVGLVGTFNVVLSTVIAFGMCCACRRAPAVCRRA
jgi:hypothetical protein